MSVRSFRWLLVQSWFSYRMMHGVLWRDISLCTDTHNNESAKPGHHNSCNSLPREIITIGRQSGIYLNHCISSFVIAALRWTVSVPLHYVFALTCVSTLCANVCVCSPTCLLTCVTHRCVTWKHLYHTRLHYTCQRLTESIDFYLLKYQATLGQPIIHNEDHAVHYVSTSAYVRLCAS